MIGKKIYSLLFVLVLLLGSLLHSVKAEVTSSVQEKAKQEKTQHIIIKAQPDAFLQLNQIDLTEPVAFTVDLILIGAPEFQTSIYSCEHQSEFLKILLTKIQPSKAP